MSVSYVGTKNLNQGLVSLPKQKDAAHRLDFLWKTPSISEPKVLSWPWIFMRKSAIPLETCCFVSFHFLNIHLFFSLDTLLIDYQFTFSLSQEDDRYYTAINFVATPDEVRFKSLLSLFWICVDLFLGHYG